MYYSNEGMKVQINKNFNTIIKANNYGINDWKVLLLNKELVEVEELPFKVNEYYLFDISSELSSDANSGAYEIIVKDSSIFNVNDVIKIKGFVAIITDKDDDDNKLFLSKPTNEDFKTDDSIVVLKYPQLNGMYKFIFQINRVGNFIINISSYSNGINDFMNVDSLLTNSTDVAVNNTQLY